MNASEAARATSSPRVPGAARGPLPALAAAGLLALIAAAGCKRESPPAARRGASAPARYAVRAEVLRVATAGKGLDLMVRHEAIPEFADDTGKVVGMDAMVMPLHVDPPVAQRVAVGDKVLLGFVVDWTAGFKVDRLERLPPDTALVFGPARAGDASAPDAGGAPPPTDGQTPGK